MKKPHPAPAARSTFESLSTDVSIGAAFSAIAEATPLGDFLLEAQAHPATPHGVVFWLHGIETRLKELEYCLDNVMPMLLEGPLRERLTALKEML